MRVRGSVPWLLISSRFQPAPTPNSKRPPDRWSTEATSLAVTIGSRSITRQTPLPTRSVEVATTAAVAAHEQVVGVRVLARSSRAARPRALTARRDVRVLGEEQRLEAMLLEHPRELAGSDTVVRWEVTDSEFHSRNATRRTAACASRSVCRMRLDLMIEGQEGVTWPQWQALALACEQHGIGTLFRSDHYMNLDGSTRSAARWTRSGR